MRISLSDAMSRLPLRANEVHRFEEVSQDLATWAVFWGPQGSEADRA
jgi:hypothetical protein